MNTKKGFTLVELLVVIAILAILATVSVVGYTSFIKRADESNAQTEAHQIEELINAAVLVTGDSVVLPITEDETSTPTEYVKSGDGLVKGTATGKKYDLGTDLADLLVEGKYLYVKTVTGEANAAKTFVLVYHYADGVEVELMSVACTHAYAEGATTCTNCGAAK